MDADIISRKRGEEAFFAQASLYSHQTLSQAFSKPPRTTTTGLKANVAWVRPRDLPGERVRFNLTLPNREPGMQAVNLYQSSYDLEKCLRSCGRQFPDPLRLLPAVPHPELEQEQRDCCSLG